MKYAHLPQKQGLYDPSFEHDSCGAGFVCNVKGEKSYDIVSKGILALEHLLHRGATGADCVGTARRQGAVSVTQIEILPKPPESRTEDMPWPTYPVILKASTSHEEGGVRHWSVQTKKFVGVGGKVKKLICEKERKEFEVGADLVILAMGFIHPVHKGLLTELGIEFDSRGNIKTDENYMTSIKGIFSAGDCHRGASLVVWAISEGRQATHSIDTYLMGKSFLPKI